VRAYLTFLVDIKVKPYAQGIEIFWNARLSGMVYEIKVFTFYYF
jgi:hypothetical protein